MPTPLAQRISAMLTGKVLTTVGIGRLDYVGRFQPFGFVDTELEYKQEPSGLWSVTATNIKVPYQHPSPRIITHAGLYVFDRWYIDELPKKFQHAMNDSDVATFSTSHIIEAPELPKE